MRQTLVACFTLVFVTARAADDVAELTAARVRYREAIEFVDKPVRDRYLTELAQLRKHALLVGNPKLALAIEEEIKSVQPTPPPANHADFKDRITSSSWSWIHPEQRLTLFKDGTAKVSGSADDFTWKITHPDRLVVEGRFGPAKSYASSFAITFAPDFQSGKGVLDGHREWDSKPTPLQ